jgi:predicted nucleotidyltransferase
MLTTYGLNVSEEKLAALCKEYGVKELALFGSRARGDNRADSDFDILVEFLPETRIGLIRLSGMQQELEAIFQFKVDLVPKRALRPMIRESVISEARSIYHAAR